MGHAHGILGSNRSQNLSLQGVDSLVDLLQGSVGVVEHSTLGADIQATALCFFEQGLHACLGGIHIVSSLGDEAPLAVGCALRDGHVEINTLRDTTIIR